MPAQPLSPGRLLPGEDLAVLAGSYHGAIEAEPLCRVRVDLAGEGGGAETTSRLKQAIPTGNITTPYFAVVRDTLDHWRRGAPPPISVHDCARAVRLIDQAYALAG